MQLFAIWSKFNQGARRRWSVPSLPMTILLAYCIGLLFFQVPGGDFLLQYFSGARTWPLPYHASPLYELSAGYFGIFMPWASTLALPLVFLPATLALFVWRGVSLLCLWLLARKNTQALYCGLTAPFTFVLLWHANIDALVAWGTLTLATPAAWLFLSWKPQTVVGLALLLWRKGGWRSMLPTVFIVAMATVAWAEWLTRVRVAPLRENNTFFPWLVPVGLILLWHAWRRDDMDFALFASPFFAPYIALHSLAPAHIVLARRSVLAGWLVWIGQWYFVLWQILSHP